MTRLPWDVWVPVHRPVPLPCPLAYPRSGLGRAPCLCLRTFPGRGSASPCPEFSPRSKPQPGRDSVLPPPRAISGTSHGPQSVPKAQDHFLTEGFPVSKDKITTVHFKALRWLCLVTLETGHTWGREISVPRGCAEETVARTEKD